MLNYAAIVKLHDQVSGPAKQAGAAVQRMSGQIQSAQQKISMMQRVQMGAAATTSKLQGLFAVAAKVSAVTGVSMGAAAASATNISAKYEDLGAVFETLEGSSQKAQQSLAWVKKFTKDTPYELDATATAFGRLRAYGIDPMDGTLTTLGDTAAAMGKEVMAAVEMMADAVVGENERLKEFGVRASTKGNKITYSYKDKSGKQQRKTVNKDDQDEIRRSLNAIFNEKYAGAMEKRSKTFNGILSNMKDTVAGLQAQFMQGGLFEGMKNGLQNRLDKLTALSESGKVEQMGKKAAAVVNTVTHAVGNITSTVSAGAEKLANFVGGWKNLALVASSFGGWWLLKDLFLAVAGGISVGHIAIVGVAGALAHWQKLLPKVSKYFPEFADWIGEKIPSAIDRFNSSMGLIKQILNGQADQWGWDSAKKTQVLMAAIFGPNIIKKYGESAKWLKDTWAIVLEDFNRRLPVLKAQAGVTFRAIGKWLDTNGEKIKTALSSVAIKALEKFGNAIEWLEQKAKSGELHKWLDKVLEKVEPTAIAIKEFATGVWEAAKGIARFIGRMAEFVGGWENFGKIVVGLGLVSFFSGLLGGIAAIAQITAIVGSGLLWLGSVLGINAVVARGFAAVLGTVWRAFKLVSFAAMLAGRALMLNPIGLTITAIATAAYLLYTNWDKVTKYFRDTTWSQMLVDAANTVSNMAFYPLKIAMEAVKQIWEWLKPLLADTSWGQAIISTVDTVVGAFERLKAAYTAAKEWLAGGITTTITAIQTGGASIKSGEGVLGKAKSIGDRIFGKTAPDGARALGGPVRAGGLYEVAEHAPEIYRQGNRAWVIANGARGGQVVNMQRYRDDREESRTAKRIPSAQASMGRVATEMRGLHELTVNLRTAPGTSATVEQKRTSGNVSKFNLGKQGGAAL